MTSDYLVDARRWSTGVDLVFVASRTATMWLGVDDLSEAIASSVTIDLDTHQRCCGVEVWDVNLLSGGRDAERKLNMNAAHQVIALPEHGGIDHALRLWVDSISCYRGDGDSHASWHWFARRAYDYSEELEDLKGEGVDWLRIGLDADGLLVGVRIEAPREHVRGLQRGDDGSQRNRE